MGLRVLITGATGMIGAGVLQECLANDKVSAVVSISRRSVNFYHDKLEEIILPDFTNLSHIEHRLGDFDACFYCLGASSSGMSEQEYRKVTLTLTQVFAQAVLTRNPDIVFAFVSAEGANQNGKAMWARVKGEAEHTILNVGFKQVYVFRPAITYPDNGIEIRSTMNRYAMYVIKPLYPVLKRLFPNSVTTTSRFGRAMIHVAMSGYHHSILGCKAINHIALHGDN